jgi:hypothetical protein
MGVFPKWDKRWKERCVDLFGPALAAAGERRKAFLEGLKHTQAGPLRRGPLRLRVN